MTVFRFLPTFTVLLLEEGAGLAVALVLRAELPPLACGARWLGAGGQGLLVEDTAFGTASFPAFTASGCRGACAWDEGRVRTFAVDDRSARP